MKRALVLVALCLSGCIVGPLRQVAVATVRHRVEKTVDNIGKAAAAVSEVAVELQTAVKEERPPDVREALKRAAVSLDAANTAANEAGKVVAVVQEDVGATTKPVPATVEGLESLISEYRSMIKLWKMASAWAGTAIKGLWKGGAGSSPLVAAIEAWSPKEISALIVTITAAAGAAGIGVKKRATGERTAAELRATVLEAEAALGECNKAMSDPEDHRTFADIMANFPLPVRVHIARRLETAQRA